MVLACLALFVALGGTAYAATHLPAGKDRASKIKRGSRGRPGPQGAAGLQGAPGDSGADGPVGPQGPRGLLGGGATAAEALARAREAKAVKLQAHTTSSAEVELGGPSGGDPQPTVHTIDVRCPDDSVVSGGGYTIVEFLKPPPVIREDARVGNGWSVEFELFNRISIKAFAVCLTPIP